MRPALLLPTQLSIRLFQAAKNVIRNWASGDLAGAVNRLEEVLELIDRECLLITAKSCFKPCGRLIYKLAGAKETYIATATSRRLAHRIAKSLNCTVPGRASPKVSDEGISLNLALAAPELAKALRRLINCPALNLDDLEREDVAALRESIHVYVRATGENPADPE